MIEVTDENLHGADAYDQPLGIECSCQRRALVPLAELAAQFSSGIPHSREFWPMAIRLSSSVQSAAANHTELPLAS